MTKLLMTQNAKLMSIVGLKIVFVIFFHLNAFGQSQNFNNGNLENVNAIWINDPGPDEGIKWLETIGNWSIDVTPIDRSNGDGNLNIYGTSNDVVIWRPLRIYPGTSGDAIVKIEADPDNNKESDNARLELIQDGGAVGAFIGFNQDWGAPSGDAANFFRIATRYNDVDFYNTFVINPLNGNIGIGVTNPTEKLTVDGKILAEEVKVQNVPQSDYVFEPDYPLLPLAEVESYIKENKHLPDIPSAEEFKQNGVGLGEMDDMLLRKIEELTLYVIELKKENEAQQKEIERLKNAPQSPEGDLTND